MESKEGKHIFRTVKVGERGQIVIPKDIRELFEIESGETLIIHAHENRWIGIIKEETMKDLSLKIIEQTE
ncbi:MAG TPA: AbrB/MazE/SpoVT family DNA-binding domain-containing protein [Methanobacteriaceae archaeon]|nr:AbrB/MazE/SpoVT family DNA-binding domain-containing protein [Methanobacteriaceae archaeon]